MLIEKLSEDCYVVKIHDNDNDRHDYVRGHIKIDRAADESSDLRYWMFYPSLSDSPIAAGDLQALGYKIAELNNTAPVSEG